MNETIDQLAREFVDDRLTPERRAEVERRIEREPALADRVAELRRIGDAVRGEDDDALSPEFYARARARFETRAHRSWFRPLSWETAGVLAAAALAAALLVPPILEQEDLGVPQPTRQIAPSASGKIAVGDEVQRAESDDDVSDLQQEPAAPIESVGVSAAADAPSDTVETAPRRPQAPTPEGMDRRRETKKKEAPAGAAKPDLKDADSTFAAGATEPDAGEAGARGIEPEIQSRLAREETSSEQPARELEKGAGLKSLAAADSVPPLRIVDGHLLNTGQLNGGEIRELRGDEARELLDEFTESFRDKNQVATRLLLIGPRDPAFGCRGIRLQQIDEIWWVSLPTAPAGSAATGGCAVELPDDGRAVRIRSTDE